MIIIFGQQDYAERISCYMQRISPQVQLKIFAFPLTAQNPREYTFDFSDFDDELCKIDTNVKVMVAFGVNYRKKAINHLKDLDFKDIEIFDAAMDNELKRNFFIQKFDEVGKKFSFIGKEKLVSIYMAQSAFDKPLKNGPKTYSEHIIPIQVGAALSDIKINGVRDDTGDNISARNRRYSEITALYWIWKNADADYLGLCHYRRLWKDLDFIADKLQSDIIDVVLPVPTLCVHSVYEDYMERYIPTVYPTMLDVLREMSPEYYEASKEIYRGHVFYACNMLIAKRRVLDKLCQWMFPVVFEIENRIGDLSDPYLNRYAGFCTERLITLYFLYNKENWRITHADKIFIE